VHEATKALAGLVHYQSLPQGREPGGSAPELLSALPWQGLTFTWRPCSMDYATEPNTKCRTIESVLVGGAVGGLIGMLVGPLATLLCAVIGAGVAYRNGADEATHR
jgi:hypothetical protein